MAVNVQVVSRREFFSCSHAAVNRAVLAFHAKLLIRFGTMLPSARAGLIAK